MKRIILLLSLALLLCLALAFAGCSQASSQLPKSLNSKPIDDFSLRVDAGSIALLQWDTEFNLDELLGKPTSEHTERFEVKAGKVKGIRIYYELQ